MSFDPREDKLPRWAQDLLAKLRRERDDAEQRADEARYATDPDGSSAVLHPWADIPVGLGADARVRFKLGPSFYVDARVNRDRELELRACGPLVLIPQVSNVVRIRPESERY